MSPSPTTKSPTARLHRKVHPSPPTTPSYYGEEDLFFPPSPSREGSAPSTPSSPTFSIPRSTSPHAPRFVKKLSSKWKAGAAARDELDFGCAGEWSSAGPADLVRLSFLNQVSLPFIEEGAAREEEVAAWLTFVSLNLQGDRYYSTHAGGNRASTSSSDMTPSLTHSRAHSSSSEFSTSTFDSSLPPSPTPSSCASMRSAQATPLSPLPYTSRVPLTPRTAQRKRQSDEVTAVDALNCFFTSVRLSQIQEDVSPASTARASFSSHHRGSASFSPPTAADILLSKNHAPPSPPHSRSHAEHDFEIEFIDTHGESTFTPLEVPSSTFSPAFSSTSSSSSRTFNNHRHSPIPDADVAGTLEELSEYFTSTTISAPSSPVLGRGLLPAFSIGSSGKSQRPSFGSHSSAPAMRRPTRSGAAGVRIGLTADFDDERRVQYAWI